MELHFHPFIFIIVRHILNTSPEHVGDSVTSSSPSSSKPLATNLALHFSSPSCIFSVITHLKDILFCPLSFTLLKTSFSSQFSISHNFALKTLSLCRLLPSHTYSWSLISSTSVKSLKSIQPSSPFSIF